MPYFLRVCEAVFDPTKPSADNLVEFLVRKPNVEHILLEGVHFDYCSSLTHRLANVDWDGVIYIVSFLRDDVLNYSVGDAAAGLLSQYGTWILPVTHAVVISYLPLALSTQSSTGLRSKQGRVLVSAICPRRLKRSGLTSIIIGGPTLSLRDDVIQIQCGQHNRTKLDSAIKVVRASLGVDISISVASFPIALLSGKCLVYTLKFYADIFDALFDLLFELTRTFASIISPRDFANVQTFYFSRSPRHISAVLCALGLPDYGSHNAIRFRVLSPTVIALSGDEAEDWISLGTGDDAFPPFLSLQPLPLRQIVRSDDTCSVATFIPPESSLEVPFFFELPNSFTNFNEGLDWAHAIQASLAEHLYTPIFVGRAYSQVDPNTDKPQLIFYSLLRFSQPLLALHSKREAVVIHIPSELRSSGLPSSFVVSIAPFYGFSPSSTLRVKPKEGAWRGPLGIAMHKLREQHDASLALETALPVQLFLASDSITEVRPDPMPSHLAYTMPFRTVTKYPGRSR